VSFLLFVEETFEFQDGTLHCAPAVPFAVVDAAQLKQGDQLELKRPNGTSVGTKLHCFGRLVPSRGTVGLCVNKPLTKADIPPGTEIWRVPNEKA
jgi:hypothetical protein